MPVAGRVVAIGALAWVGCREPVPTVLPQAMPAEVNEAPAAPRPAPRPPLEDHGGIGLGTGILPPRVRITILSVDPDEFRSSLTAHDDSHDDLLECVWNNHPNREIVTGTLVVDYSIGSAARVTAVATRSCDFPEVEMCDCMGEIIAKWRFRPNVQLVQVSLQIVIFPEQAY
jgi:hypothetical protein